MGSSIPGISNPAVKPISSRTLSPRPGEGGSVMPLSPEQSLRDSLKEFLDLESKTKPATEFCKECGSVCTSFDFSFCLDGEESGLGD